MALIFQYLERYTEVYQQGIRVAFFDLRHKMKEAKNIFM